MSALVINCLLPVTTLLFLPRHRSVRLGEPFPYLGQRGAVFISGSRLERYQPKQLLKLPFAAGFVAVTGFIALAYKIIWYRLFSFWSGSNAESFACPLDAYLGGMAISDLAASQVFATKPKLRPRPLVTY